MTLEKGNKKRPELDLVASRQDNETTPFSGRPSSTAPQLSHSSSPLPPPQPPPPPPPPPPSSPSPPPPQGLKWKVLQAAQFKSLWNLN
ncbi:hypothetical protein E2C01_060997 [Portunus trituberculatus]|uniref:Uncharacterized protein n=1 Tax=Portunus trituberculatus TaxID=210409 RepID=A0A5B7H6Z0_PORTR|nr:hypothetical protein [Portunus trituberculatus]